LITAGGSYCECRLSSLLACPFSHLYGAANAKESAIMQCSVENA
jgi:hypothetical protein